MNLDDALFNWLQIKHVAENRPDDHAAQDTFQFFTQILKEDFKLEDIKVTAENGLYVVQFIKNGEKCTRQFPVEFVNQLLYDIEQEPKYNE
ncbi:hypothetical protein CathTA2_2010 [Caldalkalibacillus thermarum TA2.A1]|uniref:Uncharacterized protein n=1 Tax=Caldalkalibacillus thermarum (strain TA2.A1) TaxID=986075 RepID=F5L858_CALTT|nr:hypothetical protein [Caldalkalibacillus thermarum]EGL82471.1 hypothetical protein CathTA2_2010 [Caldalkalibacillus thermarum TA2.A1]QZT33180.1 hypothetical protein HUR95_12840 [Caldalkalibacillus thermarum TA2.A1]GGK15037.1 hypothetical protein GCM10010965_05050 [Caldalkalibacillus thermarum]